MPPRLLIPLVLLAVSSVRAEGPRFRVHPIDSAAQNQSCTVVDVDRDGRLDVVAGGRWYRAPDWRPRFVREVEQIGGRFDDYSSLPLDVNGDGRLDLVSCNYRSKTLYWVEQPAEPTAPWTRHVVERPGPMETGRLVDVDGDGRLDVLPNGTSFAAWWSVDPGADGAAAWNRHELPTELAGHGVGFGDIDGDGRGDLVSPGGWLQAPEDRRGGRWTWHPEFRLHRDGSIPLVVIDVDGDGDQDVVYGRGHNIGLYWLEQSRDDQQRTWLRHAIDTSWSQAHSLLLADLDGDGRAELVAGKRYLGHDGRDPGEWDPLCARWYRFDRELGAWRSGVVTDDPRVGWGLDPKSADLDGDGDLDLVAADRCGLFWLENLGPTPPAPTPGPLVEASTPAPRDHRRLEHYRDLEGQDQPITGLAEWGRRRAEVLLGMQTAMGPLPGTDRRTPLAMKIEGREDADGYQRLRISYSPEPGDRVPAWLLIPDAPPVADTTSAPVAAAPRPAMLCLHQTTGIGKGEPAGLGGLTNLHYAHELARRGYICLVPDYPSFGDYPYDFSQDSGRYGSGSMKAIWNNLRGVDLLESLPEVDADRIGCIGHSLGGHNALFTAAFDQRLRAVVTSCGFTAFHHYYGGKLAGWTSDRYMPRIRDRHHNSPDEVPFDFHEVLGAIAPRPLFINAPEHDGNFDPEGVRLVVAEAGRVYRWYEAPGRLVNRQPDCGHDFPPEVREEAYRFLDEHLRR